MSRAAHAGPWTHGGPPDADSREATPDVVGGWSTRFSLGVALVGAPFVVFAGSLLVLAVAVDGRLSVGVLLPLFALGFVLEVVLGTAGVFLVLTSPELRP